MLLEVPHTLLSRVTVKLYSVLGLRPVIVHGLVVHSAQPGDGGVQLTEVVMSLGSLGWSHCRVTLHDSTAAVTLVGPPSSTKNIEYISNNTIIVVINCSNVYLEKNTSYYSKMNTILKYMLQMYVHRVGNNVIFVSLVST